MKFRDSILLCVLIVLIGVCVGYAYFRFMVVQNYMVAYEGTCDPAIHTCFVECQNDECTDKRNFDKVQKYAVDLNAECGKDITDCAAANECLPQRDSVCSITYCDPETEAGGCETPLNP